MDGAPEKRVSWSGAKFQTREGIALSHPKIQNEKGEYNMNEKHTGRVYTVCPECGKRQWVEVTFPSWNEPFEDTTFHCEKCGIELELTDPHQFDEHGNIIN